MENWRRISSLAYDKDHGETAYLLLIDNFKKLGFFEDADNCYYHYRNERRRDLPRPYKPVDWILMALYGYGVRPIRPLIWAMIFFLAFGLFLFNFRRVHRYHKNHNTNRCIGTSVIRFSYRAQSLLKIPIMLLLVHSILSSHLRSCWDHCSLHCS